MRTRLIHAPLAARLALAFVVSALLALALAGCGGGDGKSASTGTQVNIINGSNGLGGSTIDPAGDGTSGVLGKVLQTPNSPTSTTQAPLSGAKIVATLSDGTIVGSATSGGDGSYRIPLVPGDFILTAQPISTNVIPVAAPQQYRVNLHAFTNVDFSYYDKSKIK